MAANYVLLERIELNASAASVTFANIPQSGYTDLKVVASARSDRSGARGYINVYFNGTFTNQTNRRLLGDGASASSSSEANNWSFIIPGASQTANTFGNAEIYIPNYTSSNAKSFSIDAVQEENATTAYATLVAALTTNTAAITSVTLIPGNSDNFVQYSTFSLYGLAAVGTTPAIAPKATGGDAIGNDGTYWYHAFLSTGSFTPSVALSCEALLVAGGGAGGWDISGGGGAGGVVASNSAFTVSTAQTVTIGAGGTGGTYSSIAYTSGSDTVFNSWTAVGGGKGNSTGGSGGGAGIGASGVTVAGKAATQTSPSGATGYGNAGGDAFQNASTFASGGGGGAGGVGGSRSGSNGGNGGIGKNTWSGWLSATNTGVSGYIAGGGGGGVYNLGTSGSGGSGGGGAGWTGSASANPASPVTAAMNGVAGTGGGGGGAGANYAGGNGGSGIVIIRYAMA